MTGSKANKTRKRRRGYEEEVAVAAKLKNNNGGGSTPPPPPPLVSCSKKRHKREKLKEDRISELPEDILDAILSCLTVRDAARTCVLSRKWRYLWTFTARLNFDRAEYDDVLGLRYKVSSYKLVDDVKKVLQLHQGSFIDEFKIRCSLDAKNSCDIDNWVSFAFEKGVKRFELDLGSVLGYDFKPKCEISCYSFPSLERFFISSNIVQRVHSNDHWTRTVGSAGFCSLTTLCLRNINVAGQVIEHFLDNCPFLEQLRLVDLKFNGNFKVAGPSLKLKVLEISFCYGYNFVEISAINLVSFTYKGHSTGAVLKNAPLLSELCTGGTYGTSVIYKSCQQSSYLRQLERLKLDLLSKNFKRYMELTEKLPDLFCLKQLELTFMTFVGRGLISYTSLIRACPLLSRFTMQYSLISPGFTGEKDTLERDRVRRAAAKYRHDHLKVVELIGFIGHETDLELASHFLETAVTLERMVINPRTPFRVKYPWRCPDPKVFEPVRMRANQLKAILPPKVDLVVL